MGRASIASKLALLAFGVAVGVVARRARAADVEPVHFTYSAPAECPSEEEFLRDVADDGGELRMATDGVLARIVSVTISGTDALTGRLVLRELDGRSSERTISGVRCESVARALAVLVAVSIESPPPPLPVASAPPPAHPEPVAPPTRPPPVAPPRVPWRLGLGADFTLSRAAGAGGMAGVAFYLAVQHDVAKRAFSPELRVGGEIAGQPFAASPPDDEGFGTATVVTPAAVAASTTFSRRVVRVDACPFRWVGPPLVWHAALALQTCGRFDVGLLEAKSAGVPNYRDVERTWAAPGAVVRVRWVQGNFHLDVEGGVTFPLLRERFYLDPASEIYVVPPVGGTLGFGLGGFFF